MRDDDVSLINAIKHTIKRKLLGPKASGEDMIAYLRSKGMAIGANTVIHDITDVFIDPSRPWMVAIGDNVQITRGVTILTHGYDWSVFKGLYGDVLGSAGHVFIGSNVFIGMNATILKGVTIGDNVVIGANSLINKDVPSNCVVAGSPQRIICSIDEYLEKRRKAQLSEAKDLYRCWRKNSPEGKAGAVPPKRIFHEFFWLFEKPSGGGWLSRASLRGCHAPLWHLRKEPSTVQRDEEGVSRLRIVPSISRFIQREPLRLAA